MQRIVFLAGRALPAALCFSLLICKIGSGLDVKALHDSTKIGNRARCAHFLCGFAEQNPFVFLGGGKKLAHHEWCVFYFCRSATIFDIIKVDTI